MRSLINQSVNRIQFLSASAAIVTYLFHAKIVVTDPDGVERTFDKVIKYTLVDH